MQCRVCVHRPMCCAELKNVNPSPPNPYMRRFLADFKKYTHSPPPQVTTTCLHTEAKVVQGAEKCQNPESWQVPNVPERCAYCFGFVHLSLCLLFLPQELDRQLAEFWQVALTLILVSIVVMPNWFPSKHIQGYKGLKSWGNGEGGKASKVWTFGTGDNTMQLTKTDADASRPKPGQRVSCNSQQKGTEN